MISLQRIHTPLNTSHFAVYQLTLSKFSAVAINISHAIYLTPWGNYSSIYIYYGVITARYSALLLKRHLVHRNACSLKETTFVIEEEIFFSEK